MSSPIRPQHRSFVRRARLSPFRIVSVLVLAALLGTHTIGCTVLFPVVAATSGVGAQTRILPAEDLLQVEPGATLRLSDMQNVLAEGRFTAIALDSDSAYARRLAGATSLADVAALPRMGETVRIAPRSNRAMVAVKTGRFAGFDYRGVRVWDADGRVKRFEMTKIDSMWREDGRGTSGTWLAQLDAQHALPSLTTIVIEQKGRGPDGRQRTSRVSVPWDAALRVESLVARPRVVPALVMGLAADGLVVAAAAGAASSSGCTSGSIDLNMALRAHPELQHVRPMTQDFDLLAGEPVPSGPALATR